MWKKYIAICRDYIDEYREGFLILIFVVISVPVGGFLIFFVTMTLLGNPNPFGIFGTQLTYIRISPHSDLSGDINECQLRSVSFTTVMVLRGNPRYNNVAVCFSGMKHQNIDDNMKEIRSNPEACVRKINSGISLATREYYPYLPNCICLNECL